MTLSAIQLQNYNDFNKRLGFNDGHCSGGPGAKNSGSLVLSKDPAHSTLPPKMLTVNNVDELKKIIGLTTPASDGHINYPTPQETSLVKEQPDAKHTQHLMKVMRCCVAGDSNKVASSDKEILQKTAFPMTLATFSVEDHTVKNGEVLKLTDGTMANFGSLTIEAGGQIECDGSAFLNCQNLNQVGSQLGGDYTFNLVPQALTPDRAENGDDGKDGDKGAKGDNGASCSNNCKKQPSNGSQGHPGGEGGNGENGAHGVNGPILQCHINNATGNISVHVGAQAGQDGGNGGKGGNGGPGGDPGDNPGNKCTGASSGPAGDPGHGGDGGDGGKGGDGAQLYLSYGGSPSFTSKITKSTGGAYGALGLGGDSNTSYNGSNGQPGAGGADPIFEPISE